MERYPDSYFNELETVFNEQTLTEFLSGCEKAIIGLEVINEDVLEKLPNLSVISKYGVGLDSLDLQAMAAHGVALGWAPGVNKRSVSELVVGQMISALRLLRESSNDIKKGIWRNRKSHQLSSQTVGIIGLGNVGQDLVKLLGGFGCSILANDIVDRGVFAESNNVTMVDLHELIAKSDIISIHVPLNKSTKNMIGEMELSKCKSTVF